jgi:hypothetical protein
VFDEASLRLMKMHEESKSMQYHPMESTTIPLCSRISLWEDKLVWDHEVAGYKGH